MEKRNTLMQKHDSELFHCTIASLRQSVKNVLRDQSIYKHVGEKKDGMVFKVKIKPSVWLLSTDMAITLKETDSGTVVEIVVTSQPWIFADITGTYSRYIRNFLRNLKYE